MMVSSSQQTRRFRIVTAIVMLICVLALLVPHGAGNGLFFAGVLFFPVFLFGLLDPPQWLRVVAHTDGAVLPKELVRSALFQRPTPRSTKS
jgi:hypothetical protein